MNEEDQTYLLHRVEPEEAQMLWECGLWNDELMLEWLQIRSEVGL